MPTDPMVSSAKESAPQIPPNPLPKKNPLQLSSFLLGVLTMALLGSGGYFWVQSRTSKISPALSSPSITTNTTSNSTSDWQTYTNQSLGFSFQHPASWFIGQESETEVTFWRQNPKVAGNNTGFSVRRESAPGNLTAKEYWKAQIEGTKADASYIENLEKNYLVEITLAGEPALKELPDSHPEDIEFTKYFVRYGGFMYTLTGFNVYTDQSEKQELDQILSTFKFTSTEVSAEILSASLLSTADWIRVSAQTYSVMYPPSLTTYVNGDLVNLRTRAYPEPAAIISINRVGDPATSTPTTTYSGGSRREWWTRANYDQEHPAPAALRFVEKKMGTIDALEVYDGENLLGILIANRNKLYMINGTDMFSETIASTILFK